jgi:hypothetical protein
MTKILLPLLAVGLVIVTASTCHARASGLASKPSFGAYGPVAVSPGASGNAPGHLYRTHGSVRGHPGASSHAPGHTLIHRVK